MRDGGRPDPGWRPPPAPGTKAPPWTSAWAREAVPLRCACSLHRYLPRTKGAGTPECGQSEAEPAPLDQRMVYMAFPFSIEGHYDIPAGRDLSLMLVELVSCLESEHLNVEIVDRHTVRFRGKKGYFSALRTIGGGTLRIEQPPHAPAMVQYRAPVGRLALEATLLVVSLAVVFFAFMQPYDRVQIGIAMVGLMVGWLWLFCHPYLRGSRALRRVIRKAVAASEPSR